MSILDVLKPVHFGKRVAEDEIDQLEAYFVETDLWNRLYADEIDVIYGAKGAGKSALYSLLIKREAAFFDKRILLAAAENPRGTPVFQSLVTDPPTSEREFVSLWKLYLAGLAASTLSGWSVNNEYTEELFGLLEEAGIRPKEKNLKTMLQASFEYVRRMLKPTAIEGGLKFDPNSGAPTGVTGKILFAEPTQAQAKVGAVSIDRLFELVEYALDRDDLTLWLVLDRLDIAFSESSVLEQNALSALFHAYLDLLGRKRHAEAALTSWG